MREINVVLRRLPVAAVYLAAGLPGVWLVGGALAGGLGVDPVKRLEQELGLLALQLLVIGLAITPLRRHAGLNLLRFRRAVGLSAFGYALVHLAVWLALDMQGLWGQIAADLVKRPYITVGMAAFALIVPLALTSTDTAIRRMGAAAWRRLHRLVYPAALAAAVHFVMVVKAWPVEPFLYLAAILGLLALRLRNPFAQART